MFYIGMIQGMLPLLSAPSGIPKLDGGFIA